MGPEALKEFRMLLANAKTASYAKQAEARDEFIGSGEVILTRLEELEGFRFRNTPGYGASCTPGQHAFEAIGDPYEGLHAPEDDSRFGWRRRLFCTKCGATMEIPVENPHPEDGVPF